MKLDADVLVVDDDDDAVRMSLGNVLRSAGYRVAEAEDGFVAMEHLQRGRLGAVVLDVHMPSLDGLSLTDFLDDPPVLMLTGGVYGPTDARWAQD